MAADISAAIIGHQLPQMSQRFHGIALIETPSFSISSPHLPFSTRYNTFNQTHFNQLEMNFPPVSYFHWDSFLPRELASLN